MATGGTVMPRGDKVDRVSGTTQKNKWKPQNVDTVVTINVNKSTLSE